MATAIATIVRGQAWRVAASLPRPPARRRRTPTRLSIESLEVRSMLNGSAPALASFPPNETIDRAWDLGSLDQPATVLGSVGTGPAGAADVTWYHFQLQGAARVDLSVVAPAGDRPFAGVLSLFDADPQDYGDPYDPTGDRLMAQVQSDPRNGVASDSQPLGPGDYYVAISGAGNTAFSPVIAGSGDRGATGVYQLSAAATDLGLAGDGPTMLWSDPAAGAAPAGSPLAIRIGLSEPIDPSTILAGQTVQLFAVSVGGVETPVELANVNLSTPGDELQVFPMAPMAPGQYVVQLSGDTSQGQPVLADLNGVPLGEDAQDPSGADESFTFRVAGVDGVAGASASDGTAATARQLGDVVGAGLVQVAGAIGIDPAFSPSDPDPSFSNPANQVDLYHFQVAGPGRYAMLAEVFAGRIGSPLDPGVSLFERDPATGQLVFVAGNNNTNNDTAGTDGSIPLLTDAALNVGLRAGDYYLAVAGGSNTPSPIEGQHPGDPGILDPNRPGSAQNGWSTGPYLLNLMVEPASAPPTVIASTPGAGTVLAQAPQQITVQFSGAVNLQDLAYSTYLQTSQDSLPQVFVEGADGTVYTPRFLTYDRSTNTATFQMLDGLPDGSYALHLSGPGGLTDLAGDPLAGNTPGGDEVVPFTVEAALGPLHGSDNGGFWAVSRAGLGVPQDLGVLFPDAIQAGVSVVRYPEAPTDPGASAMQDAYTFQVLQGQNYGFQLIGGGLPAGIQLSLVDASGRTRTLGSGTGRFSFRFLEPGTYTISVNGWAAGAGADLSYQLLIQFGGQHDNAPPLVDGPAPALQVSFVTAANLAGAVPAPAPAPTPGAPVLAPDSPAAGPFATVTGTAGIEGGSGGNVAGFGSSAASAAAPSLASLAHAEAASGLAGLGMGPLGGSGGPAAASASPAIQVALEAPHSTESVAAGTFAVGLVTLTRALPFSREGESLSPADLQDPPVVEEDAPPPPPVEVGPRDRAAVSDSARTATADMEAPRVDSPALEVAIATAPAEVPPASRAGSLPAPVAGEEPRRSTDDWTARWAIAAATIAAVSRARVAIRGLKWIRGSSGFDAGRTVGLRGPHAGRMTAGPASRPGSMSLTLHRSRCGLPAALPRP